MTAPSAIQFDVLPGSARRVILAFNPTAGAKPRAATIERLTAELRLRGLEPQRVQSLAELADQSARAHQRGELRAVVAAGGDGTVAEIVNRTPQGTPIAVLPLGTENLLARHLGIRNDPVAVADLVAQGRTAWLDVGRAGTRLFLLMVGVGFDGEVVRRLHWGRDGHITRWSYAKPIWQAIRSYKYPELRVRYAREPLAAEAQENGWSEVIRCRWAFVFNLPRYAIGLNIAPRADGGDGLLDLCTFERGGLWAGLQYVSAVALGRHSSLRDCTMPRCRRVRIESDEPVPYEIDGDPGGTLPVEIQSVPRRLRVVVPADWSTRQPANAAMSTDAACGVSGRR